MKKPEKYIKFIYVDEEKRCLLKSDNQWLTVTEALELFKSFLLSIGYHPDNIKDLVDIGAYGYKLTEDGFIEHETEAGKDEEADELC